LLKSLNIIKIILNMTQDKNELVFCPLGGAGEIGMNMNLYGYGSQDEKNGL